MSALPILLDFKGNRHRGGLVGGAFLVLGLAGAVGAGLQFRTTSLTREGLELRLDALAAAQSAQAGAARSLSSEDAAPLVRELGAPWSLLLRELETASRDVGGSVAVLAVEPDREKGKVRIVAEARDLATALGYIERLQKSRALRFPMLDTHELRSEDHEQPVRFQLSAEWRTGS